jgi:hypothetical protein
VDPAWLFERFQTQSGSRYFCLLVRGLAQVPSNATAAARVEVCPLPRLEPSQNIVTNFRLLPDSVDFLEAGIVMLLHY